MIGVATPLSLDWAHGLDRLAALAVPCGFRFQLEELNGLGDRLDDERGDGEA